MKRKLLLIFASMVAVMILVGCKAKEPENGNSKNESVANSSEHPSVRVAVMPFLNSLPIVYMQENGLDEKYGFNLETVYFASGGPMNEALGANLWDIGVLSAASVYSLANYNAKLIGDVAHSEGGIETLSNQNSDILNIKGSNPDYPEIYGNEETLKGKTIAVPTGTISHLNVNKWLESINVDPADVNIVHMEFPQAYQALVAGKVDIAALNPPTSFEAEEKMAVTSSLKDLNIPQYDSVIVNDKYFQEENNNIIGFVKAYYEANDALMNDIDMAAELLNRWYEENGSKSTVENSKNELERRPLVTFEEAKQIQHGESVQVTAQFFSEQGLIDESQLETVSNNIDRETLKDVLK